MPGFTPLLFSFLLLFSGHQPKESNLRFQVRSGIEQQITDQQLSKAVRLKDLNPGFPSSWIKKYLKTEILFPEAGMRILGENENLNLAQQKALASVPLFGKIQVLVSYQYENQERKLWEDREIKFTVTLVPEKLASFPGGDQALDRWWNSSRLQQWEATFPGLKLATIQFLVNEKGQIQSIECEKSSGNQVADQWIINEIKKMPDWVPARTRDGKPVVQKFTLALEELGC